MGFVEDKQEVVENVGLYEILSNKPKKKGLSSIRSVRSKSKNLLPYLIDLLSVACTDKTPRTVENPTTGNQSVGQTGSTKSNKFISKSKCEASRILIEILTSAYPEIIRTLKTGIVQAIKAGLFCGSDFTLPESPPIAIVVKIKEIDYNGLLKQNPYSEAGRLLFGKNPLDDFNFLLVNLLQNGGTTTWKDLMKLTYIPSTEELRVELLVTGVQNLNFQTPIPNALQNAQQNIQQLFTSGSTFTTKIEDIINSYELINKENFFPRLLDGLTGVIVSNTLNSLDKIITEEKTNEAQKKIVNSDPCVDDYKFQDNFFEFSSDQLIGIEKRANERYNGSSNLDLGCGFVPVEIDLPTVAAIYDNIQNAPEDKVNLVIEESVQTINEALTKNVPSGELVTARFNINNFLIELVNQTLTNVIFEPKFLILYQLAEKIVNGPITTTNPNIKVNDSFDFAKSQKVFFEYVTREVQAIIVKILYQQVKKEIINLVRKASERIIKELADLRYKAISSVLTGVVDGLTTKATGVVENYNL